MKKLLGSISGAVIALSLAGPCWAQLRGGAGMGVRAADSSQVGMERSSVNASSSAHLKGTSSAHVNGVSGDTTTSDSANAHVKTSGAASSAHLNGTKGTLFSGASAEGTTSDSTKGQVKTNAASSSAHLNSNDQVHANQTLDDSAASTKSDTKTYTQVNAGGNVKANQAHGQTKSDTSVQTETDVH